jgi:hypothetical protein
VPRLASEERQEIAQLVAAEVVELLQLRASLASTDLASRRQKEVSKWRDGKTTMSECSVPTQNEADSASCMSTAEASELLRSLRRKGKRSEP